MVGQRAGLRRWIGCWMAAALLVGASGCSDDPAEGNTATTDADDTSGADSSTSGITDPDSSTSGITDPDSSTSGVTDPDGSTSGATDADTSADADTSPDVILSPNGDSATWSGDTAAVTVTDRDTLTRSYRLTTTANLRDNEPASKQLNVSELAGQPVLRSGHDLFDALFALAIDETRQNSVSSISDGAFNNGQGVACPCFETGAKWNYVWTRDTAYAADLGLALIDPARTQASLAFKLSDPKDGLSGLQIVQDTGSGGSYPVSTDRVVWAIGARRTLNHLDGTARAAFLDQTYEALVNTLAQDRLVAYDPADGLYRGEQSFLDWREQSYPSWTAQDTVHLGMSKSLSTNVGHYAALRLAADLAQTQNLTAAATQYAQDADSLRAAIRDRFWLEDASLFSALKTTTLDPAPLHRYDLLGLNLAILEGVATPEQAQRSLSAYPFTVAGPPVIWPQQPLTPIYHNRGIWPFVTAYTALAARHAGHAGAFDAALMSLIRGAALNLSNMENFEFTALAPWYDDGPYSGPVVNSRRQLWSVAGYIGAITQGMFGLEATADGLRVAPFLTQDARRTWLRHADAASLHQLTYRGREVSITLQLPPLDDADTTSGAFAIDTITLNGQPISASDVIPWSSLQAGSVNALIVSFASQPQAASAITVVTDTADYKNLWSPNEAAIEGVAPDGQNLRVRWAAAAEQGVVFNVFRDGVEVASGITDTSWLDPDSADFANKTFCYAVESAFTSSGNRAHHSPPSCYWQAADARIQTLDTFALRASPDLPWSTEFGRPHYSGWGAPADTLEVAYLQPQFSGPHLLQATYSNGAGAISTGITAALKRVEVTRRSDDQVVASGYLLMPQLGSNNWARWADSSLMPLTLDANELYRVVLSDAPNMSYLEHFRPYTGGLGGGAGVYNNPNITSLKLLSMSGLARAASPLLTFDGADDVSKLAVGQRVTPLGAPSQAWSQAGIDWDADSLYVSFVSEAFDDPFKPVMVYIEAADTLSAATPSTGVEYSALTAQLPFTPTHLVSARRTSDSGAADGPWNGVWRREGGALTRVMRLAPNAGWWVAADNHTLSLRIPRAVFDGATHLRVAAHVVNAAVANEWKDTLPNTHTPWIAGGGGYYELDLSGPHPVSGWTLR